MKSTGWSQILHAALDLAGGGGNEVNYGAASYWSVDSASTSETNCRQQNLLLSTSKLQHDMMLIGTAVFPFRPGPRMLGMAARGYFLAGLARTYLLYSCFLDMKKRSAGDISSGSRFLACTRRMLLTPLSSVQQTT